MFEKINIVLIGCGGTGGEIFDILSQQHLAMKAQGGEGLNVTAYDPSKVRGPNLVRQRFWPCDLGQYKAVCLANRYNHYLGTDWQGFPTCFPMSDDDKGNMILSPELEDREIDIIISAVDLPSVRCQLANLKLKSDIVWLDFGNGIDFGQAILGVLSAYRKKKIAPEFPHALDHYPEFKTLPDNLKKSCSTAEALLTQDILINRTIACAGMNILWQLIKFGETELNGCLVDLKTSKQTPLIFIPN